MWLGLAKLDDIKKKSLTQSLDESSYVFPDPLVSTTCNVQQLSTQMPTITDVEDSTHDSRGSYTFSSARPSFTPTIPDVEDWTHNSIGSYTFSSAHPSNVMSLSSTHSSLHSLSDDGKELNLLDEPVYRTSTARQPQITTTENVPQTPMHRYHQAHNLVADGPPHLTGPTQCKQCSRTSAPRASQLLPQPTSSESVQRGSQVSRIIFLI